MRNVPKAILLLLSAAVMCSCSRSGPVLRPEPAPVVLPPMPSKPVPQGASTARHELLQQATPMPQ
ncbi:hypothetical protein ABB26_09930 [Stenotrophomonas humi]|uniref:Uncharacterized protein n=1 Tax=Stenotrophomonas humi TaxID=405444 RepID=A0A0R0C2X9_9GAMM|nr:hypothetical protein ABB26_09930 [Stenotrophomonas humi]